MGFLKEGKALSKVDVFFSTSADTERLVGLITQNFSSLFQKLNKTWWMRSVEILPQHRKSKDSYPPVDQKLKDKESTNRDELNA